MELSLLRRRMLAAYVPAVATAESDLADEGPLRAAAVLVPVVHGSGGPGVLLTVRTATLRAHAGQVSFPGGRIEPEDASAEAAALREAREEIGLDPDLVELAGRLPEHVTGTGFHITPVMGLLPAGVSLVASADEVAEIFVLPLTTLLDPAAPQRRVQAFRGRDRAFWVWPHERHHIWGATAAILMHLAARLRAEDVS